jgi:cell division protein FtsB
MAVPTATPEFSMTPQQGDPSHPVSRRLRVLTGVNEDLLAWVPNERARYTALGGVVLGTATIAAVSMAMALAQVNGGFSVLVIPLGLAWGLFVLNLDRWLVSSSSGTRWHRRATILVPRLVLAFFFGVVIAEPLVLQVFDSAIAQNVADDRDLQARELGSRLLLCNPDPTADKAAWASAGQSACAGDRLKLQAGYVALADQVAALQDQAKTLRDGINGVITEQARRDMMASNECAGTAGPGTTGRAGRGKECVRREQEAEDFRKANPTTEQQAQLAQLGTRITALQSEVEQAKQDYQGDRDTAVRTQVDDLTGNQGAVGLLERFHALDRLTESNGFLAAATWFIRLFFILVDCLPVLVKFFTGTTRYELLVDAHGDGARRVYEQGVRTSEAHLVGEYKNQQAEAENDIRKRKASSDLALRWHEAQLDAELTRRVDVLADRYRPPAAAEMTIPMARVPR